jgi:hypothetical protein
MPIAIEQFEFVGPKIFAPDGPITNFVPPLMPFKPGTVVAGDAESEFVYLMLNIGAATTLQQGNLIGWDNSYQAYLPTTANQRRGDKMGSFWMGGRYGDPGGLPSGVNWPFSMTLTTPGTYGIWVQRSGAGLVMVTAAGVTAPSAANPVTTTTTAGTVDAPNASVGKVIQGLYLMPTSITFTANTTSGSAVLSNVSSPEALDIGMAISGTNIPAGCFIASISGNTITMGNSLSTGSALATATGSGITVTAAYYTFTANTVNGSPVLTNVSNVAGVFPGSLITTAAVAGMAIGTTVLSIAGNPSAGWTLTMSANATSTTTASSFSFAPPANVASQQALMLATWNWGYIQ